MLLRVGSIGQAVNELQNALGLEADGIFGKKTEAAVKTFQKDNDLIVDGIVGPQTWAFIYQSNASTDLSEKTYSPIDGLMVNKHYLPDDEYFPGPNKKEYLFLHHTAGWHNPYNTITSWANDNRGKIATEFVLGGRSVKGDEDKYDGELVHCIPEGGYAWHLGKNGSPYMHRHSVGIEICNFGYAENGKTYVGTQIEPEQIVTLTQEFRGYQQWHAYSDKQLETLRKFILWIAERDGIQVTDGLVAEIKKQGTKAFEFNQDAYDGKVKGLWTHTNTRKDKFDLSPQPRLMDMLLSL